MNQSWWLGCRGELLLKPVGSNVRYPSTLDPRSRCGGLRRETFTYVTASLGGPPRRRGSKAGWDPPLASDDGKMPNASQSRGGCRWGAINHWERRTPKMSLGASASEMPDLWGREGRERRWWGEFKLFVGLQWDAVR